jgi:hypothetical protein
MARSRKICARLRAASAMTFPDANDNTFSLFAIKHLEETEIMKPRRTRNRTAFGFESLEIRNAPSHFGVVAQAAAVVHHVHAAAHVKHLTDSEVNHKKELTETVSSADTSKDASSDPGGVSTSKDSSGNDPGGVDPKSDN